MGLPFKKTNVSNPDGFTLAQSRLPAALQVARAELDRLNTFLTGLEAHVEQNATVDLVAAGDEPRSAVLTPLYTVGGGVDKCAGGTAFEYGNIYALLKRVSAETQNVAQQVSTNLERIADRKHREQQADEEAERIRQAELAEIARIEELFAKHGRKLPVNS